MADIPISAAQSISGLRTPGERVRCMICATAIRHGATFDQVTSESRLSRIVIARQHCFAALRALGLSSPRIGRHIGGRDHTTVLHGLKRLSVRHQGHTPS